MASAGCARRVDRRVERRSAASGNEEETKEKERKEKERRTVARLSRHYLATQQHLFDYLATVVRYIGAPSGLANVFFAKSFRGGRCAPIPETKQNGHCQWLCLFCTFALEIIGGMYHGKIFFLAFSLNSACPEGWVTSGRGGLLRWEV